MPKLDSMMALAPCTDCGRSISNKAAACPQCGARPPRKKWWLWILLLCITALAVLIAIGSSPQARARIQDEQVIEMCWDDYRREAADPNTGEFVASTCRMLESKYEQKYGRKP